MLASLLALDLKNAFILLPHVFRCWFRWIWCCNGGSEVRKS